MVSVTLVRTESSDEGTFGVLVLPGFPGVFYTGELPDRDNAPNVSCIPTGTYKGVWVYSPRFKRKMFLIEPTAPRSGIRIHSANFCGDKEKGYKKQLHGCIALGEKRGKIDGQKAVLLSMPAIRRFEKHMNGENFTLEIIKGY